MYPRILITGIKLPSQCLRGERKLITTTFTKLYAVEIYFLGENKGSQISPQHSCFYISDLDGSNESLRSWAKCFGKSSKIKCTWSFLNCFWNEQQYNPSAQKRNSREPVIVELYQPIGPDSFRVVSALFLTLLWPGFLSGNLALPFQNWAINWRFSSMNLLAWWMISLEFLILNSTYEYTSTACVTESTYVLIDPASINRMPASQCNISCLLHWFSTRENSEVTCSTILHIPRILSAWGIKERTPLLQTPEHKTTSPSYTAQGTSKHAPELKGSGLECEHLQLYSRLQMAITVRSSTLEYEWHKLWTPELNGDARGETYRINIKERNLVKTPSTCFLSFCVNVTVIQEASAAVLIRVSHTWEALMPVPPILFFWL